MQVNPLDLAGELLSTKAAAEYLTAHGLRSSASILEKLRARGTEDPRDRGPDYWRDQRGRCLYPRGALDRYVQDRLRSLKFRAPASQPTQFRKVGA